MKQTIPDIKEPKTPSSLVSIIPFLVLVALLFCVIRFFGADALSGASQVCLLLSAGVVTCIAVIGYKVKWSSIEDAIVANIKAITPGIIILLLIGAVSGTWMISGVVPTLMFYGIKILSPKIYLFAICVICAFISLLTGSSWTTIATMGVAFIGIGMALGYSPGWTAGAIISGAYFGDKISPLSDTTVLASSTTDTPLFTHIRYMLITTIPSFTIASILFLIVSLSHPSSSSLMIGEFSEGLQKPFNISPWLIIVPVITGFLIAKKIPAIATLFLASLTAGITAIIAQPDLLLEIGGADGFEGYFRGIMTTTFGSTSIQTGNETLDNLIQTSGMTGMLATIFLIITASTFGGALTGSGMIKSLTDTLAKHISGRKSLVSATVATGLFCNMTTGDQYLSILLTNNLYKKLYDRKGFERRLLSRTTEDSCTVTSVLIPWNSCGMTQSTVLKVPTLDYLPYCFFNILSPLMSMFIAFIGYKIFKKEPIET